MTTEKEKLVYEKGLAKTRGSLWGRLKSVLGQKPALEAADLEAVEDALIAADVGMATTMRLVEDLKREPSLGGGIAEGALKEFLSARISRAMAPYTGSDPLAKTEGGGPQVILVVGVNGTGKTTTIGKLASIAVARGHTVMLVAADTYRAAAARQLAVWADRSGAGFVEGPEGGDPAAVVHDGLSRAVNRSVDLVLIDTAGRLHTKEPLMKELEKMRRVAGRIVAGAPQRVLLVLDATTGQNALAQARTFTAAAGVTDLVVTKMDGSARGGFLLPVAMELNTPVSCLGMGEGIDDLVPFDPEEYARNLVGL